MQGLTCSRLLFSNISVHKRRSYQSKLWTSCSSSSRWLDWRRCWTWPTCCQSGSQNVSEQNGWWLIKNYTKSIYGWVESLQTMTRKLSTRTCKLKWCLPHKKQQNHPPPYQLLIRPFRNILKISISHSTNRKPSRCARCRESWWCWDCGKSRWNRCGKEPNKPWKL